MMFYYAFLAEFSLGCYFLACSLDPQLSPHIGELSKSVRQVEPKASSRGASPSTLHLSNHLSTKNFEFPVAVGCLLRFSTYLEDY